MSAVSWLLLCAGLGISTSIADDAWSISDVEADDGKLRIRLHDARFATYSYRDETIPRPYFANIVLPGGVKLTRNHPPQPGDIADHATFHPGVWLAFGDISGNDYWRLRAKVKHFRFTQPPQSSGNTLRFAVENDYRNESDSASVCLETCRYELQLVDGGVLMRIDSTFRSDEHEFYFGDQEEMGLGIRVATPIAVKSNAGGRVLNSDGKRNEEGVWGKPSAWCDYAGMIDGRFAGILLMPHPDNFRPCWYHARDYGFVTANPFGRNAFTDSPMSKIIVAKGGRFRLRFGVFLHAHDKANDFDAQRIYQQYIRAE